MGDKRRVTNDEMVELDALTGGVSLWWSKDDRITLALGPTQTRELLKALRAAAAADLDAHRDDSPDGADE